MKIYALVAAAGLFLVVGIIWKGQRNVSDSLENIKVRIGTANVLPDPTKIETTGDWYFLDHISSGLVSYDFDKQHTSTICYQLLFFELGLNF